MTAFLRSEQTPNQTMSLHAQIAPETRQRLASQRRASTLTGIIVALLVMALISVVLMIIALASSPMQSPLPQYRGAVNTPEEKPRIKKTSVHIAKRPSPPSKVPRPTIGATNTPSPPTPLPRPTPFVSKDSKKTFHKSRKPLRTPVSLSSKASTRAVVGTMLIVKTAVGVAMFQLSDGTSRPSKPANSPASTLPI